MNDSGMLSTSVPGAAGAADSKSRYNTEIPRYVGMIPEQSSVLDSHISAASRPMRRSHSPVASYPSPLPAKKYEKHVVFQLIDQQNSRVKPRLPMRVMIFCHDTVDAIATTVKNFYGLIDCGVSFELNEGISLIAAYENFENNMTVYVRPVEQSLSATRNHMRETDFTKNPPLSSLFEARLPGVNDGCSSSANDTCSARKLSMYSHAHMDALSISPSSRAKPPSPRTKSKDEYLQADANGFNGADSDQGSVTRVTRLSTEHVTENIGVGKTVSGGKRKRNLESPELPLFLPAQMPNSAPALLNSRKRYTSLPISASSYAFSNHQTTSHMQPFPSSQSCGTVAKHSPSSKKGGETSGIYLLPNSLAGSRTGVLAHSVSRPPTGILPAPDATTGNVISDRDVAMRLMRLGNPPASSQRRIL